MTGCIAPALLPRPARPQEFGWRQTILSLTHRNISQGHWRSSRRSAAPL